MVWSRPQAVQQSDMTDQQRDIQTLPLKLATDRAGVGRTSTSPQPENRRVRIDHLTGAQKAAIVVRALIAHGADIPISKLPNEMQAELTQTLGRMRLVDRATMNAVVEEFIEMLEQVGLSFPDDLDAALSLIEDKLDQRTVKRLRAISRGGDLDDAWMTLELAEDETLLAVLKQESQVVSAVLLSKLTTEKAARLLMQLGPDLAQSLAMGIAQTEAIGPDAVARIGATLADQISAKPLRAFADPPKKRVGEILNSSTPEMRDSVLEWLETADKIFARDVRKSIFTFKDIADRIHARDVPIVMREVANDDMLTVIAAKDEEEGACIAFLLENMSKRAATTLQDDAAALPPPAKLDHGAASNRIAAVVRRLVDTEEITLKPLQD